METYFTITNYYNTYFSKNFCCNEENYLYKYIYFVPKEPIIFTEEKLNLLKKTQILEIFLCKRNSDQKV